MSIYDYAVLNGAGEEVSLSQFKGKVILIVNTATGCGFTPHYEQLEAMYRKYSDQGFEILDIPCNQFGGQAPGTDEEIHSFCVLRYHTSFPQMKKSDVNGENKLPLYTYLKKEQPYKGTPDPTGPYAKYKDVVQKMWGNDSGIEGPDIRWNFTKFVVDRDGDVVARFEPTADMADVEKCVASLL
ncbi:MAG: glutathione peroxidase [Thermoguttaceae bacterium]|nr:glutathione peroxidase [Thermoguttaceae bacterium]